MNSKQPRYVLGIDPSGNWYEGKGTTGWCLFDKQLDKVIKCGSIQASQYNSQVEYWEAHIKLLRMMLGTAQYQAERIVVSMEDYVLYSNTCKSQINSAMETSQLIGVIKIICHNYATALHMRTATRVKKRWTDHILSEKGYLRKCNRSYFVDCKSNALCDHERDAIRHAVHCATFELKEVTHE